MVNRQFSRSKVSVCVTRTTVVGLDEHESMHERLKAGAWALGGEREGEFGQLGVLREYTPSPLDPVAGLQDDHNSHWVKVRQTAL